MFFSVIIPIYNVEKYLNECIDSILCQTYTDFELILVDDGSTDTSGKICDEYAQKDQRIKVIHKENGGQSTARNIGLVNSNGAYIVYLDSDDFIISKDFLADLYDDVKKFKCDIVLYKHMKFFDNTKSFEECQYFLPKSEQKNTDQILMDLVSTDSYFGMAWTKAFRKEMAIKNNVKFDTSLSCEDMDWYFNLVLHSQIISTIDRSYIAYRQRDGSITATIKLKNLIDFVVTLERWSKIIKNAQISDKKRTALMGALAKYYSNLLITYMRLNDKNKKQYKSRIKKLSYLLDYSLSTRPLQIRKFYKIAGFEGVILMLKIYDKIK